MTPFDKLLKASSLCNWACWSVSAEKNSVSADQNVVAIARSVATLNCINISLHTSTAARWHYLFYGWTTPVGIYNGREINADFRPRYNVQFDSATSSSLLTIKDVRISDAGTYSCSKLSSRMKIAIIHLNVLGTCDHVGGLLLLGPL